MCLCAHAFACVCMCACVHVHVVPIYLPMVHVRGAMYMCTDQCCYRTQVCMYISMLLVCVNGSNVDYPIARDTLDIS